MHRSFNTQPPEGGWVFGCAAGIDDALFQHTAARRRLESPEAVCSPDCGFNTQPPEGGWEYCVQRPIDQALVSTHSRPKAAGAVCLLKLAVQLLFQHTAARRRLDTSVFLAAPLGLFQHTAARRRLESLIRPPIKKPVFQHTAARRRLGILPQPTSSLKPVSTHSRPKAAGCTYNYEKVPQKGFNTQPPEGGWRMPASSLWRARCFNTQPPEGGWVLMHWDSLSLSLFQHTAARRRLGNTRRISWIAKIVSTHSRPKAAGNSISS